MSTTARKTKGWLVIPRQHGAWVMLLTSWLCGVLFAGRLSAAAVFVLATAACLFVVQANLSIIQGIWKSGGNKRTVMEITGIALITLLMPITVAASHEFTAQILLPWLVLLMFFWGSVLRVRLLLRGRHRARDKQWRAAAESAAYHMLAMAFLVCASAWSGGSLLFPVVLLAPALAESLWMALKHNKPLSVKSSMVGLGELLLTVWLVVMTQCWLVCFV